MGCIDSRTIPQHRDRLLILLKGYITSTEWFFALSREEQEYAIASGFKLESGTFFHSSKVSGGLAMRTLKTAALREIRHLLISLPKWKRDVHYSIDHLFILYQIGVLFRDTTLIQDVLNAYVCSGKDIRDHSHIGYGPWPGGPGGPIGPGGKAGIPPARPGVVTPPVGHPTPTPTPAPGDPTDPPSDPVEPEPGGDPRAKRTAEATSDLPPPRLPPTGPGSRKKKLPPNTPLDATAGTTDEINLDEPDFFDRLMDALRAIRDAMRDSPPLYPFP